MNYIKKLSIIGMVSAMLLSACLHGMVTYPDWKEFGRNAYEGTLTSEMAEKYVRKLICYQLDYWKQAKKVWTKKWTDSNKPHGEAMDKGLQEEFYEIPPCVFFNDNITDKDLLKKVFVYSDINGQKCYKKDYEIHNFGESWEKITSGASGFFTVSQVIYIANFPPELIKKYKIFPNKSSKASFYPYGLLATINHELVHAYQYCNAQWLQQKYKDYSLQEKMKIVYLVNKDAYALDAKLCQGKALQDCNWSSSNDISLENEADRASMRFVPNKIGLTIMHQNSERFGCRQETECGYCSFSELIELAKQYNNASDVQEHMSFIFSLDQKKCDYDTPYKLYCLHLNNENLK